MGMFRIIRKIFKKRTILAVLLTVVFMVALKGFYRERIFELSFDIKTSKAMNMQFFYCEQWESEFDLKDSICKKVETSSSYKKVKLELPVDCLSKFRMDFDSNASKVFVKNVQINNIRLDLGKLNFNQIDKHSLKSGELSISSNKKDPYIVFTQGFNGLKRRIDFHYEIFIILLFIIFLINYKLVQYLVSFKLDGNNSRLDILFLLIFFVAIFVPMTHLSDAKISEKENRSLAKYVPFLDGKEVNLSFGSDFESFFNDRFFGRDFLMDINKKFKLNINEYYENAKAFRAKDNWLFDKVGNLKKIQFDKKQEKAMLAGIDNYIKFCKDNNIAYYIEIAPAKVLFALDKYHKFLEKEDYMFLDFQEKIKEKLGTKFIYPYAEMIEADKSDYVYFKTDHHWTEWGAYAGYKALIEEIQKDFKDVPIAKETDLDIFYNKKVREGFSGKFRTGHTSTVLNLSEEECNLDTNYKYYTHKNEGKLKINIDRYKLDKLFYYPEGANYKVVLLGNSFTESFSPFLPYSFKNVKKLRANNRYKNNDNYLDLNRWKEEILEFKPDIMIILMSGYLYELSTIKELN